MIDLRIGGKQVVPSSSETIKLTSENPYFSGSSDYTYQVTLPLDILINRTVFGSVNRIDWEKQFSSLQASFVVDNHQLITGTSKVVKVDQSSIKIQLLGNNSAYKDKFKATYIDQLSFGVDLHDPMYWQFHSATDGVYGIPGVVVFYRVHDTTNDLYNNCTAIVVNSDDPTTQESWFIGPLAPQPNLLYVLKEVCRLMGYTIDMTAINKVPYTNVYIANARTWYNKSADSAKTSIEIALPHWTVEEFLTQIQYFFNVTISFNSASMTAMVTSNCDLSARDIIEIEPEDEYDVDVSEEEDSKSLAASDIAYSLSDSDYNKYLSIEDDILDKFEKKTYASFEELVTAYDAMDDTERGYYIFVCPSGQYIRAGDIDDKYPTKLMQINVFGEIRRNTTDDSESSDSIEMKICPVAIEPSGDSTDLHIITVKFDDYFKQAQWAYNAYVYYVDGGLIVGILIFTNGKKVVHSITMRNQPEAIKAPCISIEQPRKQRRLATSCLTQIKSDEELTEFDVDSKVSVSDAILGNTTDDNEAEDRMQVFFSDTKKQTVLGTDHVSAITQTLPCAFTHVAATKIQPHEAWSFALNANAATYSIAQLHANLYSLNTHSLYTVKFKSNTIPDSQAIFTMHNKRFLCKKIETEIKNGRINELMTGYFYEII